MSKTLRPAHRHLIEAYENASLPDGVELIAIATRLAQGPLAKAAHAALLQVEAEEEARARWAAMQAEKRA